MADGVQQVGQGRLQVGGGGSAHRLWPGCDDDLGHRVRYGNFDTDLDHFRGLEVIQQASTGDADQGQCQQPGMAQHEGGNTKKAAAAEQQGGQRLTGHQGNSS
ncbi:hypothetical protein FQZ97_1127070 [compost metagenome]